MAFARRNSIQSIRPDCDTRQSLTPHGQVCYQLKTPYRDGTTHVVFAPNSVLHTRIIPAQRGQGGKAKRSDAQDPTPRHLSVILKYSA